MPDSDISPALVRAGLEKRKRDLELELAVVNADLAELDAEEAVADGDK